MIKRKAKKGKNSPWHEISQKAIRGRILTVFFSISLRRFFDIFGPLYSVPLENFNLGDSGLCIYTKGAVTLTLESKVSVIEVLLQFSNYRHNFSASNTMESK